MLNHTFSKGEGIKVLATGGANAKFLKIVCIGIFQERVLSWRWEALILANLVRKNEATISNIVVNLALRK